MPSPEEVVFRRSMSLAGTDIRTGTPDSTRGRPLHTRAHSSSTSFTPTPPRRATRSSSQRRSVSGMKGLMPLALSPTCSSPASFAAADESMDQRTDGCFPEVLARNLESSTDVFAAKNMTAGCPTTTTTTTRKHKSCPTQPLRNTYASASASARVRSLGAIQERNVIVSFLEQQQQHHHHHHQHRPEGTTSDVDSVAGTDTSGGVAPPSFRYREQSFTTAATSLTSTSWRPSPKEASPVDEPRELSWIEIESDEDEDYHDVDHERPVEDSLVSLAPRPQTPPGSNVTTTEPHPSIGMDPHAAWNCNSPLHHKSHSVGAIAPSSLPLRNSSRQGTDMALGRTASTRVRGHSDFSPPRSRSPTQRLAPRVRMRGLRSRESIEEELGSTEKANIMVDTTALSDYDSDGETQGGQQLWNRPSTVYIRPSPPPSPLPSVQAWLNNSVRPFMPGHPSDDLSRAMPLPPDVTETLRVSIACFPETMLLSSSLTVETIRTYSRKVRHPNLDLRDLPNESPLHSARRSIWRRVRSYRRPSIASEHQRTRDSHGSNSNQSSLPSSASSSSIEAPPPWLPLKHVFGVCSEYICDALYAHILAYNYISALVPRNTSQQIPGKKPKPNGNTGGNGADSPSEDIPKKAASLLGLSSAPNPAAGSHRLMPKKLSMARLSWGPGKDGQTASQQAISAAQEHTARDLQAGLMRCIVRLVATAKLMSESGTGEERMVEMDAKEVDVLFTRSLCEMVRISEEVVLG